VWLVSWACNCCGSWPAICFLILSSSLRGYKDLITLYSGTPSSGKSYHAICLILRVLSWGRLVIANFSINFTAKQIARGYAERFIFVPNDELTIEYLVILALERHMIEARKESQALVVVDEAGGRFNVREGKGKKEKGQEKEDRQEWCDFFSQHAKIGFDFLLIAQQDRMVDRQIRGFIEFETMHRKLNRFGPFAFMPFTMFVAVERWYQLNLKMGSDFMFFRKKVAAQYDRFKMFSGFKLSPVLMQKIEARLAGLDIGIDAIFEHAEQSEAPMKEG
jgi:zona occludens toxin